jgi:phage terminase small subunit
MTDGLNNQEEAFARAIALEGMGPSAAYRHAYASKMAPAAVASNAKRLLRRSHVKRRIEELKEQGEQGPGGPFKLTPKQDAFCRFYVEKSNASEAYRLAYDVSPSTKPETVHRKAAELLANGKVTARLADLYASNQKQHEAIIEQVSRQYQKVAFFDITQVLTWGETVVVRNPDNGEIVSETQSLQIKAAKDMPPEARTAISSIKQTKDGLEVRFHDRIAALDSLAKVHGMFKQVHEHGGKDGGPIPFQHLGLSDLKKMTMAELDEVIRVETEALAQLNGDGNAVH